MTKPSAKAKRLNDTGHRRGGYGKSDFIDMRGQIVGSWLVREYLYGEDQMTLDTDWSDHYWEATCTGCGHQAVLERRQIRGRNQKKCPVCKVKEREADREKALRRTLAKREAAREKRKSLKVKIATLLDLGLTQEVIAKKLGMSQSNISYHAKTMGLGRVAASGFGSNNPEEKSKR